VGVLYPNNHATRLTLLIRKEDIKCHKRDTNYQEPFETFPRDFHITIKDQNTCKIFC